MFLALLLAATLSPVGYVNDFAGLLRPETISSLETTLAEFERATGNEIVVVTISTHGTGETIETYAVKLFEEWGIGKEKEDNGLLLLVARDDREMRIEVGYGLEPVITDLESSRIIREVLTPAFQTENYDGGITAAVNRIMEDIGRGGPPPASPLSAVPWGDLMPLFFFAFIFLASILARSKSWWAGGIIGGVIGALFFSGLVAIGLLAAFGLLFDFIVSRSYKNSMVRGVHPPWWAGGPPRGGGFGGFGGGMSGGGGSSGRW